MTTLFLSPHLDDVALSCAARLLDLRHQALVATVFSGGARRGYAARRREDRHTLEAIGVEVHHLGLLDAPFRLGVDFSSSALWGEPRPSDIHQARALVTALVEQTSPDSVWLPLGVGGHVDHRLVFALREFAGDRVSFYLERPYAFEEAAVSRRCDELAQLGLQVAIERAAWPRDRLFAMTALIDGYRSQVPRLFGTASCRSRYEQAAVADAHCFELVASVRMESSRSTYDSQRD